MGREHNRDWQKSPDQHRLHLARHLARPQQVHQGRRPSFEGEMVGAAWSLCLERPGKDLEVPRLRLLVYLRLFLKVTLMVLKL